MKERIYSIPLTDALNEGCGCILCTLEKKLEEQAAEYFLGPSMMEPDGRELTNEKGFCRRHLPMLFEKGNRLGLALVLETHIKELSEKLAVQKKSGFMAKGSDPSLTGQKYLNKITNCALCDKLNSQIKDAAGNLAFLWDAEEDFRKKFEAKGALCPEHSAIVLLECENEISSKKRECFVETIINLQKKQLDDLYDNLHEFALSFDYRNSAKPLSNAATLSVENAVKYLSKY